MPPTPVLRPFQRLAQGSAAQGHCPAPAGDVAGRGCRRQREGTDLGRQGEPQRQDKAAGRGGRKGGSSKQEEGRHTK